MMAERARLVRALSTTKPASKVELGQLTGLSEARVSALLSELEQDGLPLCGKPERGCQLAFALAPIDLSHLKRALALSGFPFVEEVVLLDAVDSTSDWLTRAQGAGHDIHGRACVTEYQSAGRGRRGRAWQGAPYCHLMLSLGWRFKKAAVELSGLSLCVGVAIADRLHSLGAVDIGLKWPNDLLCPAGKLGGVLVEVNSRTGEDAGVVIGVGINLYDPSLADLNAGQPITDLATQLGGIVPQRTDLIASILADLAQAVKQFESVGFIAQRDRWNALDVFSGQKVSAFSAQQKLVGIGEGVDPSGRYQLRCDDGAVATIIAGDISLSLTCGDTLES